MQSFLQTYQNLHYDNLDTLENIYAETIRFIDPAHEIKGLDNLTSYFSTLYQHLESISFSFHHAIESTNEAYVQWNMTFRHRKFAGAEPITVTGATFLQFNDQGKVVFHRDYFDLGAMVYEHIPLLGRIIASVKRRLGQ